MPLQHALGLIHQRDQSCSHSLLAEPCCSWSWRSSDPQARVLSAVLLLLEELDGSSLGRVESRLQVLRRQRAQEEGRD